MSLSVEIRVLCVPEHLHDAMWPHVAPLLTKGLAAATTSSLADIQADLARGTDHLWCVFENEWLVAAFISAVYTDQGAYLGLYALGGQGMWKWAREIDATMQAEARRRGLQRIRFAGRKAWSRVLPGLVQRGQFGPHEIWERAA
jgi:hypothetical protein